MLFCFWLSKKTIEETVIRRRWKMNYKNKAWLEPLEEQQQTTRNQKANNVA